MNFQKEPHGLDSRHFLFQFWHLPIFQIGIFPSCAMWQFTRQRGREFPKTDLTDAAFFTWVTCQTRKGKRGLCTTRGVRSVGSLTSWSRGCFRRDFLSTDIKKEKEGEERRKEEKKKRKKKRKKRRHTGLLCTSCSLSFFLALLHAGHLSRIWHVPRAQIIFALFLFSCEIPDYRVSFATPKAV